MTDINGSHYESWRRDDGIQIRTERNRECAGRQVADDHLAMHPCYRLLTELNYRVKRYILCAASMTLAVADITHIHTTIHILQRRHGDEDGGERRDVWGRVAVAHVSATP